MPTREKWRAMLANERVATIGVIVSALAIAAYKYFVARKPFDAMIFLVGFFALLLVVAITHFVRRKLRERLE